MTARDVLTLRDLVDAAWDVRGDAEALRNASEAIAGYARGCARRRAWGRVRAAEAAEREWRLEVLRKTAA